MNNPVASTEIDCDHVYKSESSGTRYLRRSSINIREENQYLFFYLSSFKKLPEERRNVQTILRGHLLPIATMDKTFQKKATSNISDVNIDQKILLYEILASGVNLLSAVHHNQQVGFIPRMEGFFNRPNQSIPTLLMN